MFRQGTDFSLRDKQLFEISEFEIARVNCMFLTHVTHMHNENYAYVYLDHNVGSKIFEQMMLSVCASEIRLHRLTLVHPS